MKNMIMFFAMLCVAGIIVLGLLNHPEAIAVLAPLAGLAIGSEIARGRR